MLWQAGPGWQAGPDGSYPPARPGVNWLATANVPRGTFSRLVSARRTPPAVGGRAARGTPQPVRPRRCRRSAFACMRRHQPVILGIRPRGGRRSTRSAGRGGVAWVPVQRLNTKGHEGPLMDTKEVGGRRTWKNRIRIEFVLVSLGAPSCPFVLSRLAAATGRDVDR